MAATIADFRTTLNQNLNRLVADNPEKRPAIEELIEKFRNSNQTLAVLSRQEILDRNLQGFPRRIDPKEFPEAKGFEIVLSLADGKVSLTALELSLGENRVTAVCFGQEVISCWDTKTVLLKPV